MRVRVELLDMTCKATQFTEDIVTGGDELYVLSAFFADGADVKAGSTTPINIDAGQTKAFNPVDATGRPERMLFDADVPETATIQGALVAYDEDFSKQWDKRPQFIDELAKQVGLKIITSAPGTPLGILLAAAGVAAVATIALVLPIIDPDDQLGNVDLAIPAQGPPVEQRSWEFRGGDSWWSDWHYSIRYQIIREGKRMVVSADPTGVLAGQPTQLTVRAEDALSHAPVSGEVWIDGTRVGSLNTPFTYTFSSSVFATAKAASYLDGSVLIYVRPRTLLLSVQPYPVPTGRPEQVTVSAEDADTHTPVSGSVIVNGAAIGLTNMPFTYTFRCRAVGPPQDRQVVCPQGVVSAAGYDVTPIDFGF